MNYFWAKINKLMLFLGDILILYLSLWLTLLIRYRVNYNMLIWKQHLALFSGLFVLWLIIYYAFNLYDRPLGKTKMDFLGNYFKAALINLAVGVVYFYVLSPKTDITPKTILVILAVISSIFYFGWHTLSYQIINSSKFARNLIFVGYSPFLKELLAKSASQQNFGYNYKGIVTSQRLEDPGVELKQYRYDQLEELIRQEKINLLVINEPDNKEITNLLFHTLTLGVNFISLTNFYEQNTYHVPLQIITHGWFLDNLSEGNKYLYENIKRFIDILLAVIFGLVSIILAPFIALSIALNSKGAIIFKQKRVGKDGKVFLALKFRTMYQNAEKRGPTWAEKNDPRVTTVGKFLRKTRLDEIPQLLNILRGEMSFVGPRPERPEFIDELKEKIPYYQERLLTRPGLTGWAQINFPYAASVEDSLKKLQYDLYYIKHRSLLLDLSIVLKTINIILKGGGR